ncbi:uncharacterized protein DEA37_0010703 [Paragonimus westermani]|uniref:BTB domain-containing protein n=1 Tax=Paragonimus westermani TaxID=34504 RepID=A0A5J4NPZ8_9TREM|nr:uncharacterized protein DEA37_0010703 [Paragonimus westermani]
MNKEQITLVAEDRSFTVPREVLVTHSHYFSAALASGMSESATCRFVFPDLSASCLALFVRCACSGFACWPDDRFRPQLLNDALEEPNCSVPSDLAEVLELASLADYWQIPVLTDMCVARLASILNPLFEPKAINSHQKHACGVFQDYLPLWAQLSKNQTSALNCMLFKFATRHPNWLLTASSSALSNTTLQPMIIHLVLSILSSDLLCVSDETQVLHLSLDWIHSLVVTCDEEMVVKITQAFLDCVRPGLLTESGQRCLLEFWSSTCPQIEWQDQLSLSQFASIARRTIVPGPFACPPNDVLTTVGERYQAPRVSAPCLLSLVPSVKQSAVNLWLFNLHTGKHKTCPLPDHILSQLSNNPIRLSDVDSRLYVCHPSIEFSSNTVIIFCYDPISNDSLNGFIWCLATCQAKWLPTLSLRRSEAIDSPTRSSTSFSASFRSRHLGLTTRSDGVYAYSAASVHSAFCLHVFRFDFRTWTWHAFHPVLLLSDLSSSVVSFTPVDQLNCVPPDGWFYANLELIDRSNAHVVTITRRNLHQTSQLRSHFYRFRPCNSAADADRLEVELLPSAPFLIRIYKLLALHSDHEPGSLDREYLFAFGTCSRDQRATQFCFDVTARRWIEWSGTLPVPSTGSSFRRPALQTNLCPELLGFRGLVCVSPTPVESPVDTVCEDESSGPAPGGIRSKAHALFDGVHLSQSTVNPTLVLAGRPDHHVTGQKQSAAGVWFHQPRIAHSLAGRLNPFEPGRPRWPLSNEFARALYQADSPVCVVLANWDHVTHTSELFHFVNRHPASCARTECRECGRTVSPDLHLSAVFPCLNYVWNAGDSD